jgi:hypothetical protein
MQEKINPKNLELKEFVDLVMEYELEDPIDFGEVVLDERKAFEIMSDPVLQILKQNQDNPYGELILAIALAKAMTENMILQIQKIQNIPNYFD